MQAPLIPLFHSLPAPRLHTSSSTFPTGYNLSQPDADRFTPLFGVRNDVPASTQLASDAFSQTFHKPLPNNFHRLFEEIGSTSTVFRNLMDRADAGNIPVMPIKKAQQIIITGIGSSYLGPLIAESYLQATTGLPVRARSTEALMENDLRTQRAVKGSENLDRTILIPVSQSGETGYVVKALDRLTQGKGKTWVFPVINTAGSTIATRYSPENQVLLLNSGEERNIPATKSLITTILALELLGIRSGLNGHAAAEQLAQTRRIADRLDALWNKEEMNRIAQFVKAVHDSGSHKYVLMSHGLMVPMLQEAQLKLKETSVSDVKYADSSEFFRHGPITIMTEGKDSREKPNLVYMLPQDLDLAHETLSHLGDHLDNYRQKMGQPYPPNHLFLIAPSQIADSAAVQKTLAKYQIPANHLLKLPATQTDRETMYTTLHAIQLISVFLTAARGLPSPNHPMLDKSVAVAADASKNG